MHKAGNGDCLTIQTDNQFMMIDGGTAQSFDEWKNQIIGVVDKIDVLIITHIDNDHVNGIVKLLMDEKCPEIGEVYFNGVEQLFSNFESNSNNEVSIVDRSLSALATECLTIDSTVQIGFSEGTSLSYLLHEKEMKCNPISAGQAIYREDIEQFNSGNLKFNIIGPTFQDLKELSESWKDCLRQKNIRPKIINKVYSKAFESYLNKIEEPSDNIKISLESLTSVKALALAKFIPDPSLNNKSSLSFMLQSDDKKILFLGDCHAETVEFWLSGLGMESITVDAVKISHHGSKNNTSLSLLERIKCNKYFVSTNGKKHSHPDLETLARIAIINKDNETYIYINYKIEHIPLWFLDELKEKYSNIKIIMDIEEVEI
ncbi:ComEC/Rec2 family competence protein [Acinetobacter seifertii]|uniref:ComEC/Rec2 family competence protein n=1 Tax=Acinetobacter seifertii TaxID=1530123 RepID=UPI0040437C09